MQRTPASQGTITSFEHSFSRRENTTGLQSLQLCRTLDIQETPQETLQVVSLHGFNAFSNQKNTPDAFHAPVCPCDVITQKQCHLVVGHTLRYIVSKNEVNRTDGS